MKQAATSASRARRICLAFATATLLLSLLLCALCPASAFATPAGTSQASSGTAAANGSTSSSSSTSLFSALSALSKDEISALSASGQQAALVELPRTSMVFKISGDTPFEYPVFTFSLKADKAGSPMPADASGMVKTCTLQGAGAVDFGSVSVEKPGVYTYTISQEPVADAAWNCDTSVYELKIVVTQKDDGLSATKTLAKDGQQQDEAAFVNSYRLPANTAQPADASEETGAQDEAAFQDRSVEVGPLTLEEEEALVEAEAKDDAQSMQSGQSGQADEASASENQGSSTEPQMRPQPAADGLATGEHASARTPVQATPEADPTLVAVVVTAAVAAISIAGVAAATFLRTRKKEQA